MDQSCQVCGSVYVWPDDALKCSQFPAEPELLHPGSLVEARDAAPQTGAGFLTSSFLIGLDDPRGDPHTRFYRVSFLWGRADFRVEELIDHGPTTEAEWRAAVTEGRIPGK